MRRCNEPRQIAPLAGGAAAGKPPGRRAARLRAAGAAIAAMALVAGCAGTTIKHGHQFHDGDLQQIQPGMSVDQVKLVLGSPATTATVNNGAAYYYISSTDTQVAFLTPKETDRQIVAVYFTQAGSVKSVANYGLKDGKVFDHVSRTTPAPGAHDENLLKQLFRNLGKKQLFGE